MLAQIMSIISVIRALLDLWKYFQNYQESARKAEAEKKRQAREEAIDQSVKAETQEEIWASQDKIASNKP
jgi:hypothetical protein